MLNSLHSSVAIPSSTNCWWLLIDILQTDYIRRLVVIRPVAMNSKNVAIQKDTLNRCRIWRRTTRTRSSLSARWAWITTDWISAPRKSKRSTLRCSYRCVPRWSYQCSYTAATLTMTSCEFWGSTKTSWPQASYIRSTAIRKTRILYYN